MRKHETPITRWYWRELGGLLCEEFGLVDGSTACGRRLADAVVLPERETRIAARTEKIAIRAGERAVVLQTMRGRLGMYLMGQTLFSAQLLQRRFPSAAVESVACTRDDEVLRPMLEAHDHCPVVVMPGKVGLTKRPTSRSRLQHEGYLPHADSEEGRTLGSVAIMCVAW